jgi:hypothetical protein
MPPLGLQRLLTVPLTLLIAPLAWADAITGRVVDANGVGVAGVDIDFVSLGSGGNPHELNDGTDANGNFLTTVDPGVYEIRFYAPAPPTTNLLTGVLPSVVVTGTKNLGTITLTAGVSVQGTVKNVANQPVGGVRIDVFREDTGAKVLMKNNFTSAFGTFSLAVPANVPLRSEYLTSSVIGQVLVPRELFGTIPFSLNVGTVTLQPGFHVTGTMHTQSGSAILGADVDVIALPAGNTLFTPSDNTNGLGVFDVVVPAGTYDLEITRPGSLILVAVDVDDLVVNAPVNLGVMTMRNGVIVSGTVRDRVGNTVAGVDVNAFEVATGLPLALGSDNSNLAGVYSVVLPPGLIDLVFSPPGPHTPNQKRYLDGVLVGLVNMTRNIELPSAPRWFGSTNKVPDVVPFSYFLPLSSGTTGTGGTPVVDVGRVRSGMRITLLGGRPGAEARLVLGGAQHPVAPGSNVHTVAPALVIPVSLDAEGRAELTLPKGAWTATEGPVYAQLAVSDPAAPRGIALSSVVSLPTLN